MIFHAESAEIAEPNIGVFRAESAEIAKPAGRKLSIILGFT